MIYENESLAREQTPAADTKERLYRLGITDAEMFTWAVGPTEARSNYAESLGVTAELVNGRRKRGLRSKLKELLAALPKSREAVAIHEKLRGIIEEEEKVAASRQRYDDAGNPIAAEEPAAPKLATAVEAATASSGRRRRQPKQATANAGLELPVDDEPETEEQAELPDEDEAGEEWEPEEGEAGNTEDATNRTLDDIEEWEDEEEDDVPAGGRVVRGATPRGGDGVEY